MHLLSPLVAEPSGLNLEPCVYFHLLAQIGMKLLWSLACSPVILISQKLVNTGVEDFFIQLAG
nr:hypothetical protein Itr_chr04CG24390 [Ipomoea trifida]